MLEPLHEPSRARRTLARYKAFARECRLLDRILPAAFLSGTVLALGFFVLFAAPSDFPAPSIFKVKKGEALGQVASDLKTERIVRSARVLATLMQVTGGNRRVREGAYFFPSPQNAFTVAIRLTRGDFELTPVRVTIPEGADARDIAAVLGKKLAPFDAETFLSLALPREGYLYPDTYFFFPGQDADAVESAMEANFRTQTAAVAPELTAFDEPLYDVVIMASLLEKEARMETDRRTIAGILWKRLSIGMPLQVDAAFGYVLDKNLTKLTTADLKEDSPYNTYTNKGLPPTPIGNPSLQAIRAAATPVASNYLYYLSDQNGVMRYAATYEQHLANKRKYLGIGS